MTDTATILDMCCVSRMFWYDKQDPRAVFSDTRYAKDKQVARCGNAVPPPFAEALVRANLPQMCSVKERAA